MNLCFLECPILTTHMEKRDRLPFSEISSPYRPTGKKHAASLTPGDGVHATDASVVRPAPVGFGLLFGRIGPEPSFMAVPVAKGTRWCSILSPWVVFHYVNKKLF